MSGLFEQFRHSLPWVVLAGSFLGSSHCALMCGGIAAAASRDKAGMAAYQVGRALGYACLGMAAGSLGDAIVSTSPSTAIIAFVLLAFGALTWAGQPAWVKRRIPSLWPALRLNSRALQSLQKIRAYPRAHSFGLGLITAALPCAWLHGFVLLAASTQSPFFGAGTMLMFWLGSVPALSIAPRWIGKWVGASPARVNARRWVVASLILITGATGLALRMSSASHDSFVHSILNCHFEPPSPSASSGSHSHGSH